MYVFIYIYIYIYQFPPNTIKSIRQHERINKKKCRQKMSIMFNDILYIYIYIYIYIVIVLPLASIASLFKYELRSR